MTTDEAASSGPGEALSYEGYARLPGVNWSKLKWLLASPLKYKHGIENPIPEDSDAFRMGRAVHAAVFEPDKYLSMTAVWTGGRRFGKEWNAFEAEHAGRTILTEEQALNVLSIRDAVRSHPLVQPYLSEPGEAECMLTWEDAETGLPLKCRVDWLTRAHVIDLKTSRHAVSQRLFASQAYEYGYFHQLAFYQRGIKAARGEMPQAIIVAVEPARPHDIAVYRLAPTALYAVHEEISELLGQLRLCLTSGNWPGKFDTERELDLPRWAQPSIDDIETADPDWMK